MFSVTFILGSLDHIKIANVDAIIPTWAEPIVNGATAFHLNSRCNETGNPR